MTIAEALNEARLRLSDAQIPEPRLTASVLLGFTLGRDRAYIFAHSEDLLTPEQEQQYRSFIDRRATGEPLQYLTGCQEFYGLDFTVTPAVLIPRPETELIIDQVIKLAAEISSDGEPLIVDVGTGSGCIAVTLAVKLPQARLLALDISPEALAVAAGNAKRHGVETRVELIPSDLFAALQSREPRPRAKFIVSNPPYVAREDLSALQREVREFEPHTALFADEGGIAVYRRILAKARAYLKSDGYLILEIGFGQLARIEALAAQYGWTIVEVAADLQGIPRTVTLRL